MAGFSQTNSCELNIKSNTKQEVEKVTLLLLLIKYRVQSFFNHNKILNIFVAF